MRNYRSTVFLSTKREELMEAFNHLPEYATIEEINEYTSLRNGMLKCYLKAGILVPGPKAGKKCSYKLDVWKINDDTIKAAYAFKESNRKLKLNTEQVQTFKRLAKKHGFTPLEEVKKDKSLIRETPVEPEAPEAEEPKETFPSIEDCISYLKHHYSVHHEVIIIQEGFKLDSYTVKSVK